MVKKFLEYSISTLMTTLSGNWPFFEAKEKIFVIQATD
jgi:hypothetical protein